MDATRLDRGSSSQWQSGSQLDLWVLVGMGLVGCALGTLAIDPAPLIIAVVLGPIMEKTLHQTLFMAHGDWRLVVFRPLSLTLLLIGLIVLVSPAVAGAVRRRRGAALAGA